MAEETNDDNQDTMGVYTLVNIELVVVMSVTPASANKKQIRTNPDAGKLCVSGMSYVLCI